MDQPGNNHLLLRASQSAPPAYNGQHAVADRMRELLARTVHDHIVEERSVASALQEIRLRLDALDETSVTAIAVTIDGLAATHVLSADHSIHSNPTALPLAYFARRVTFLADDTATRSALFELDPLENTLVSGPSVGE